MTLLTTDSPFRRTFHLATRAASFIGGEVPVHSRILHRQSSRLTALMSPVPVAPLSRHSSGGSSSGESRPLPALREGSTGDEDGGPSAVVMNSLLSDGHLGVGAVVEHSVLEGEWHIGDECMVSGIRVGTLVNARLRPGVCIQEVRLEGGAYRAITVHGLHDAIKHAAPGEGATLCNLPWDAFLATAASVRTDGAGPRGVIADVWPYPAGTPRTLWNARLFPVFPAGPATLDGDDAPIAVTPEQRALHQAASLWMQVCTRVCVCR